MHVICSRSFLNEAIAIVQKAIATRSPNPILEGILIDVSQNTITLTGYDLETGIEYKLDGEVREEGSVVVQSKMFGDIVRKLPDEVVDISTGSDLSFTIRSGNSTFKIRSLEAGDYPKIPVVEESQKVIVPQSVLRSMIMQTIFASSNDESRPVMNGLNVSTEEKNLEIVAVDGFRLAVRREELENKNESLAFNVPAKAMAEVARIMSDSDAEMAIYPSHNHILFENDRIRLVSRLIQGDFMDYRKLVPPSCRSRILINTKEMLEAIERASLVINVELRRFPVTLSNSSEKEMMITAKTDLGHVEEMIPIELSGDNIDIDFNPKYFLDTLRALDCEKIVLEMSGPSSPCLIKPVEGDSFLYLLLPLRR